MARSERGREGNVRRVTNSRARFAAEGWRRIELRLSREAAKRLDELVRGSGLWPFEVVERLLLKT
jgi:hypothetical protein